MFSWLLRTLRASLPFLGRCPGLGRMLYNILFYIYDFVVLKCISVTSLLSNLCCSLSRASLLLPSSLISTDVFLCHSLIEEEWEQAPVACPHRKQTVLGFKRNFKAYQVRFLNPPYILKCWRRGSLSTVRFLGQETLCISWSWNLLSLSNSLIS